MEVIIRRLWWRQTSQQLRATYWMSLKSLDDGDEILAKLSLK